MHVLGGAINYIKLIIISTLKQPGQFFLKTSSLSIFSYIIPLILIDWYLRRDERKILLPFNKLIRLSIYIVLSILILKFLDLFSNHEKIDFIYFQF